MKVSPKNAQTSKITRFFHKKCIDCARPHTNQSAWCTGCRGGNITKGAHIGKSYRYILDHQTKYAKWVVFENGDEKHESFRRWILTNPSRHKIVTDCTDTIGTLEESDEVSYDSEDSCSGTESASDSEMTSPPFKAKHTFSGPSFSSNPRVRLQTDGSDGTVIQIGKHCGRSYNWIFMNDPRYCDWVRELSGTVSPDMYKFREWLHSRF